MAIPGKNEDLHGNAPDEANAALLLIDVINDLEFEGGELLIEQALPMARHLAALKQRAKEVNIPVIYANDNFGKWRSDFRKLIDHCLHGVRGQQMVELSLPDDDDYFVPKPKHSAFFSTTLETLLDYLKVKILIVTGIAGNICEQGYGLMIHDGYRPWAVTKIFWDATPADKKEFVADPAQGSRHNRGCAVDLSLFNLKTGKTVVMPSGYDEMSERSHINYTGGTDEQRRVRDLLRAAMETEGFVVYEPEWWHYDYKDWKEYPILNIAFSEIHKQK